MHAGTLGPLLLHDVAAPIVRIWTLSARVPMRAGTLGPQLAMLHQSLRLGGAERVGAHACRHSGTTTSTCGDPRPIFPILRVWEPGER